MAPMDMNDSWRKRRASLRDEAPRPVVLVIDDDASARESLQFVLKDKYDVVLGASAKEGLDAFHDGVRAVILDVKMEGHDGFWACDELHKKEPEIPVIFYTAYQSIKDPSRVISEHRPFDYVIKDGDIGRLLTAVDTAVRVYTMMRDNNKLIERLQGQKRGA